VTNHQVIARNIALLEGVLLQASAAKNPSMLSLFKSVKSLTCTDLWRTHLCTTLMVKPAQV
jgi:hypothetical protein